VAPHAIIRDPAVAILLPNEGTAAMRAAAIGNFNAASTFSVTGCPQLRVDQAKNAATVGTGIALMALNAHTRSAVTATTAIIVTHHREAYPFSLPIFSLS
jgi:hypothetical protein